jgi:hypothetical protein
VAITTNAPGLAHELVLLAGDDPGAELARTVIEPGDGLPGVHSIAIPPDPAPGVPADYYLAVGVRAGSVAEQQRHVIPVTTRPPG